ncbi:unnamed protein product [Urochloa humidicola]
MAGARWTRRPSTALLLVLLLCAFFLCAVQLLVPAARRGEVREETEMVPAAASSASWPAGGRRGLPEPQPGAARSRRFRVRGRWNSAGLGDSKHEVPSGPNPDSNR